MFETGFLVLVILAFIQRFIMSNNKFPWLGGIIPIIFFGYFIYLYLSYNSFSFKGVLPITIGTTTYLSLWIKGRKSYKSRINRELNIIKAKNNQ